MGSEGSEGFKKSSVSPGMPNSAVKIYAPGSAMFRIAESVEHAYNQSTLQSKEIEGLAFPRGVTRSREKHRATASRFFQDSKEGRNSYIKATHQPYMQDLQSRIFIQHQREKEFRC